MSKYQFRESDIYLAGTDIPKNRLGITEADLLHEIEEGLLQQAYQIFIAELQAATRFDETYFKSCTSAPGPACTTGLANTAASTRITGSPESIFPGDDRQPPLPSIPETCCGTNRRFFHPAWTAIRRICSSSSSWCVAVPSSAPLCLRFNPKPAQSYRAERHGRWRAPRAFRLRGWRRLVRDRGTRRPRLGIRPR